MDTSAILSQVINFSKTVGYLYGEWLILVLLILWVYFLNDLLFGRALTRKIRKLRKSRIGKGNTFGLIRPRKAGEADLRIVKDDAGILVDKRGDGWEVYSGKDAFNLEGLPVVFGMPDLAATVNFESTKAAEYFQEIGLDRVDLQNLDNHFILRTKPTPRVDEDGNYVRDKDGKVIVDYQEFKVPREYLYLRPRAIEQEIKVPNDSLYDNVKAFFENEKPDLKKVKIKFPDLSIKFNSLRKYVRRFTPQGMNNLVQRKMAEENAKRNKGVNPKFIFIGAMSFLIVIFALKYFTGNYIPLEACREMSGQMAQQAQNASEGFVKTVGTSVK